MLYQTGLVSARVKNMIVSLSGHIIAPGRVVKKVLGTLAIIGQGIECRNWDIKLQAYITLVRLHVEYSMQFWLPYYTKNVIELERVNK